MWPAARTLVVARVRLRPIGAGRGVFIGAKDVLWIAMLQ
jgi:hypothetical protein